MKLKSQRVTDYVESLIVTTFHDDFNTHQVLHNYTSPDHKYIFNIIRNETLRQCWLKKKFKSALILKRCVTAVFLVV